MALAFNDVLGSTPARRDPIWFAGAQKTPRSRRILGIIASVASALVVVSWLNISEVTNDGKPSGHGGYTVVAYVVGVFVGGLVGLFVSGGVIAIFHEFGKGDD